MAEVKGVLVTGMRTFLLDRYGKGVVDQAVTTLDDKDAKLIKRTFLDGSFYPYDTMAALAELTHALTPIRKTTGQARHVPRRIRLQRSVQAAARQGSRPDGRKNRLDQGFLLPRRERRRVEDDRRPVVRRRLPLCPRNQAYSRPLPQPQRVLGPRSGARRRRESDGHTPGVHRRRPRPLRLRILVVIQPKSFHPRCSSRRTTAIRG